jgi:protein phosphatase
MTKSDSGPKVTRPLSLAAQTQELAVDALSQTQPLPADEETEFTVLAEGTLLNDDQYVILEVCSTSERLNVYYVEDTTPVRFCLSCNSKIENIEENFCATCGAELADVEPVNLCFYVKESPDMQAFAVASQLLTMRLVHPGLELPYAVFAESHEGMRRYYLVEREAQTEDSKSGEAGEPSTHVAKSATEVLDEVSSQNATRRTELVLNWGAALAQAMSYLHRQYVSLSQSAAVDLNHIAVDESSARWVHLEDAVIIPLESRPKADNYFLQDVQALMRFLCYLLTGAPRYADDLDLPEDIAAVFARVQDPDDKFGAKEFAQALEAALRERRHPNGLTLVVGRRTDVGVERSLNEDSLLTMEFTSVFRSVSLPVAVFAVADGMGGHDAGDVASRLTVQTVAQQAVNKIVSAAVRNVALPDTRQWLTQAVLAANRAVYTERKAVGSDMGCTLVMALFIGEKVVVANVGDSRAYRLGAGGIRQVTVDHSLVERLVAAGQITRAEARHHPQKNVIYRVVGSRSNLDVDLFEQSLMPGEAILLCSDGLTGMVRDERIWKIWQTSTSPQDMCDRLIEEAKQAGGEDNISVVIVQVMH